MTITTTSLGPHTTQISLSGENSPTNFINALDTAITNGGWSQYDVTNKFNRIYSCTNADGQTLKLIGIFIDPGTLKISTTSYELWNATTHVGVNETFTYNKAGTMGYSYNACDVIVMVSSKWLFLQTFINNQMSPWSGVVELAREAPEDTPAAGYPCWAWLSSVTLFSTTGDANRPFVSLPRTVSGATGLNACLGVSLNFPNGTLGATLGSTTASLSTLTTYGWNTSNTLVQQARPVFNLTEMHGQMFGLKFTSNIGSPYNQISIPVDSNFNMSASGSGANHWVMGANPNTSTATNLLASSTTNTNGYCAFNTAAIAANAGITAVPVGTNWYVATSSGVSIATSSGSTLSSLVSIPNATGGCLDMVYDGARYVYVSYASGVYRIDTQNSNTIATLTINNGTGTLFYDGTYLWAGARLSVANNTVYQIDLTSFASVNTITLPNIAAGYICGICSDYQGNTYVSTSEPKVYKITNNTATVLVNAMNGGAGFASGISFNGDTINVATCSSGAVYLYQFSLGGTVVNYAYYAVTSLQAITTTTWLKMATGKLGFWDFCNTNYVGSYGTTFASGTTSIQNISSYLFNFNSDGNKAWGFNSTTFVVFTNLYHPDETTTTFGRVLIPT